MGEICAHQEVFHKQHVLYLDIEFTFYHTTGYCQ